MLILLEALKPALGKGWLHYQRMLAQGLSMLKYASKLLKI